MARTLGGFARWSTGFILKVAVLVEPAHAEPAMVSKFPRVLGHFEGAIETAGHFDCTNARRKVLN